MTLLRKTASAALVVAVLAGSGLSATTANAASMIRVAPVETQAADVVQVGFKKKHHHKGWGHGHWRHYGGYGHGYGHNCFWKKRKFFDEYYGWHFKRVRVCF